MGHEFRWMIVLPPMGFARQVGLEISRALQAELGEGAHEFDSQEALRRIQLSLRSEEQALALEWVNQQLLVKCLEWRVSHVFVLSSSPVDPHFVELLRKSKICAIHWLFEDYHLADYWSNVIGAYDLFLCNQFGPMQRECLDRHVPFRFLPLATSVPVSGPCLAWSERTLDIAFAGEPSSYRIQVLETLVAAGLQVGIMGEGWGLYHGFLERSMLHATSGGPKSHLELLRTARMSLHLSMGNPEDGGEDCPMSPLAWDAAAMGALPLVERLRTAAPSLGGLAYHTFLGSSELLSRCLALRSEGVGPEVLLQNQQQVQREHNMNHRVRQVFAFVEGLAGVAPQGNG